MFPVSAHSPPRSESGRIIRGSKRRRRSILLPVPPATTFWRPDTRVFHRHSEQRYFAGSDKTAGFKLRLTIALFVLSGILSIRLFHTYSKVLREWDYHYLEILAFAYVSLVIYFVFRWEMRSLRVYWPDFLWVSVGLFICPFITGPSSERAPLCRKSCMNLCSRLRSLE